MDFLEKISPQITEIVYQKFHELEYNKANSCTFSLIYQTSPIFARFLCWQRTHKKMNVSSLTYSKANKYTGRYNNASVFLFISIVFHIRKTFVSNFEEKLSLQMN